MLSSAEICQEAHKLLTDKLNHQLFPAFEVEDHSTMLEIHTAISNSKLELSPEAFTTAYLAPAIEELGGYFIEHHPDSEIVDVPVDSMYSSYMALHPTWDAKLINCANIRYQGRMLFCFLCTTNTTAADQKLLVLAFAYA
jgi:hypothetical protein